MRTEATNPDLKNEHSFGRFITHLSIYIAAMVFIGVLLYLFAYNLRTWVLYIGTAWGIILIIHFIVAYLSIRRQNRRSRNSADLQ